MTPKGTLPRGVLKNDGRAEERNRKYLRITASGTNVQSIVFIPMTRIRVLAVMLVTTLVATHSHSPWSSLLRDRNCKLPLGRTLCLLLLGFPTFSGHRSDSDLR